MEQLSGRMGCQQITKEYSVLGRKERLTLFSYEN
jgi:hypothetical protein